MVAAAAALAAAQQRNRRRRRRPPPRAVLFEHVRFNRLLVAITYRGRLLSVTDAKARVLQGLVAATGFDGNHPVLRPC